MAKVEKAHSPDAWAGWATTRDQLRNLIAEMSQIIGSETNTEVNTSLSVPGFERSFEHLDEFSENVGEQDWLAATSLTASLSSGSYPDILFAHFTANAWSGGNVALALSGGSRRSRNAIQPDLYEAVGRYARPVRSGTGRVFGWALTALLTTMLLGILGTHGLIALGLPRLTSAVVAGIAPSPLVWMTLHLMERRYRRLLPAVEFLPDDGISRWERERNRRRPQLRLAGTLVVGGATVVGAIAGLIAVIR